LTCWGSGPLNYRRASAPVLAAACAPALSVAQADQLIRVRDQSWPPVALDDALRTLVLTDSQRRVVHARLAEQSDCHSLWILVQAPATRHPWCELVIAQSQAAGQQKLTRFCW
jgi:type II secretory pathway component PulK